MQKPTGFSAGQGFLVACFAVVGLVGIMVTFIAPLPSARAMRRDATLDQVMLVAATPDAGPALERLRPMLDDSAVMVLPPGQPITLAALAPRVLAEREAMRARFEAEQASLGFRLRVLIGIVTLMAAGFGLAITRISR